MNVFAVEVLLPGADSEPRLASTPSGVMTAVAAAVGQTRGSIRDEAVAVGLCAVAHLRMRHWPLLARSGLLSLDVWARSPSSLPPLPDSLPPIFLVTRALRGDELDALFEVSPTRSHDSSAAFVVTPARIDHMLSCMIRVGLLRLVDLTRGGEHV